MRILIGTMMVWGALVGCDSKSDGGQTPTDTATNDTSGSDVTAPETTSPIDIAEGSDGQDGVAPDLAGPEDTSAPTDVSPTDVEPVDTSPTDTSPADVEPADTAPGDTGGEVSAGACDNTADFNTLAGLQATIDSKIQTCAFECLGQGAACATTCVQRETSLSSGCSTCFGEVIACTITNCVVQCLNAASAACKTCRDTNCTPAFEECAGIVEP